MKKICLIFVIFALFVFAGCGSSKNKENKTNPDAEESVTDEDTDTTDTEPADTASDDPDSGSGDSGDTGDPDSGDTNSDTGDTNDPEEPDISDSVDDTDSYYDDSTLDDTDSYYDDSDTDETCAENYSWTGKECLPECGKDSETPCYDSESGLIWSEKASTMTWSNAKSHCTGLNTSNYGGFSRGWHLPNIDKLKTLLTSASGGTPRSANCAVSETNNCLTNSCWTCSTCTEQGTQKSDGAGCSSWGTTYDDGRFSKLGDATVLWSSSLMSDKSNYAWNVFFSDGILDASKITSDRGLRCVRKADYVPSEEELSCIAAGGILDIADNNCTKNVPCNPIPETIEHADWNGSSTYVSTYDFATGKWSEKAIKHSNTPGECTFECVDSSYKWIDGNCVLSDLPECANGSATPCYDSQSSLIWSEKSEDKIYWRDTDESGIKIYPAKVHCDNLNKENYGGFSSGWHLPTISELRTLILNCPATQMPPVGEDVCKVRSDEGYVCLSSSCYTDGGCWSCSSDLNGGHNKFGETGWLWSSSLKSDTNYAWSVGFSNGGVSAIYIDYTSYVRCVRNAD